MSLKMTRAIEIPDSIDSSFDHIWSYVNLQIMSAL